MLQKSPTISEIHVGHISDEGLRLIASCCGLSLRKFEAQVNEYALEAIKSLCQACPNLRSLSLANDGDALNGDEIIQTVAHHCPMIESMSTRLWGLTDAGLNTMATMQTLKELDVASDDCTSAAIEPVLKANPELTFLTFHTPDVDDALLRCIGTYCEKLKRLKLCQSEDHPTLSDNAMQDLFLGCPRLETLELQQRGGISKVALRSMFEYCQSIDSLSLSGGTLPEEPLSVGGPVLYAPCSSLAWLHVGDGGAATSALKDIFTYCINLQGLTLHKCTQLTDESIEAMAQNCTSLTTLSLWGCSNVTISGLVEVATHCISLKRLALFEMFISDDVLTQLSLHCHRLNSLYLCHCVGGPVTEAGVLAVVEGCISLSSFIIRTLSAVQLSPTLELLKEGKIYPRVKFLIGP